MRCAGLPRATLLILFGFALLSALVFVNLRFARSSPGGNDFLPRWLGTHLHLTNRQNPYSPETTLAIQEKIYGRAAQEGEDQALFAYPFYSMLFFAPFALVGDYAIARAMWITFQEVAIVATVISAIALSGWRPGRWPLAAFLFFGLAWFHAAKPLVDGNAAILVGALMTLGLLALRRGRDGLAGLLFALSTIKPQMVVLVLPFVLIWCLSQKRKTVFWAFFASLVILLGVSFVLQPNWLTQNIAQAFLYQSYSPPATLAGIFSQWWGDPGRAVGWVLNLTFGLLLVYEWFGALRKDFDWFLWAVCLTLAIGPLVGVPATSANYAILVLVLPLIFAQWQQRVGAAGERLVWFDLGVLFVGLWALFLFTLQAGPQFRENLVMLFPAPIFLLLNLYWLRWWAQRPVQPSLKKPRTA